MQKKSPLCSLYSRTYVPQVSIGMVQIGNALPIALQSMTNTNTNNVEESVAQCIRIFDAGADVVRLTAQGIREAEALAQIKQQLVERGYTKPLVADIHFNPQAALISAQYVDKVRINPGNYISSKTKFDWTDTEYTDELLKIRENLLPLISVCKTHNTAIRVGVNHGSLSQRIIARYGDTPEGMVESMMEFLRVFAGEGFANVVCSVKSSNTRTMIYAYRLLMQTMQQENCMYPLHLGLTEAGADEDGRIKSAVGIGTLLFDGLGDTIRVSLTEAPEKEIPVCKKIVSHMHHVYESAKQSEPVPDIRESLFSYSKYVTNVVAGIGGENVPIVFAYNSNSSADWYIENSEFVCGATKQRIPIISLTECNTASNDLPFVVRVAEHDVHLLSQVSIPEQCIVLFEYSGAVFARAVHSIYTALQGAGVMPPVLFSVTYDCADMEMFQIAAAMDIGGVFIDGFGDGICIQNVNTSVQHEVDLAFGILQASRARFTKTEFIACPSCGRTLFNIEDALRRVKQQTSHLKGLKIAVMGCVVNGPGEMADADYGYVGAGPGKVHLYRKQTVVKKNIDEQNAVQTLLDVIREYGDWHDEQ